MCRLKDHLEKKRKLAEYWEYAEKEFMDRETVVTSKNIAYWNFFNNRFNR